MASVVLIEGDEACTTTLCQKCFNKHLQAKGEKPLTNVKHVLSAERPAATTVLQQKLMQSAGARDEMRIQLGELR